MLEQSPLLSKNSSTAYRILVAGMGDVLHRDDGFGLAVVQKLAARTDLPRCVKIIEVGIGGISLVQELLDKYEILLLVDAVERGGLPGTIYLLEPEVPDLAAMPYLERQDFLADMHYTTVSKALILAKALKVLPPKVFILGCQPSTTDDFGLGLSRPVEQAVEVGVERLVRELQKLDANLVE